MKLIKLTFFLRNFVSYLNFIIRIFNVFYRAVVYFYKTSKNVELENKVTLNVILFYYCYNIICFILSYLLIVRTQYNLYDFNFNMADLTYVYSNLCACILALIYMDYISENSICYRKILLNKLGYVINFIIVVSVTWGLLSFVFNCLIFQPILCSDTTSNNDQINQNTQEKCPQSK